MTRSEFIALLFIPFLHDGIENGIEIIPDDDPRRGTHYFLPSEGIDYDKISAMVRDKYLPEMVDLICGGLPK